MVTNQEHESEKIMNLRGLLAKEGDDTPEEVKILSLTLKAQEGEFAQIELLCEKKNLNTRLISLSCDGFVFFKGHLLGGVESVEPDCMKLMYIGRALDKKYVIPQENSLLKNVDFRKWELPFVNPVSHESMRISMLPRDTGEDFTPYVLMDSVKVEQIRVQLKNIKVVVHAAWVQKGQGSLNLFPYIKKV